MRRGSIRGAVLCMLVGLLLGSGTAFAQRHGPPWLDGRSKPEDLDVWPVTFGPGSDVPSWWGHASLVVRDNKLQEARLYNYGMFSFDETMLLHFAMGRLEFWVGEADVGWTLAAYADEDRNVHIQPLNLLPEERAKVAKALATNVLPENRDYLYDHYKDNCATRLRDMIDLAVGGQLSAQTSRPGRMTLREHTRRYTSVSPVMSWILDFMMNSSIDQPLSMKGEAFLPDELERQVATLSYRNSQGQTVPISRGTQVFHEAKSRKPTPAEPPRVGGFVLLVGALLGAITALLGGFAGRGRRAARWSFGLWVMLVGLVTGLVGTVLLFLWVATNHTVAFHNQNLLLASPVNLGLVWYGASVWRGKNPLARARLERVALLLLGLAVLAVFARWMPFLKQDTTRQLFIFVPLYAGLLWGTRFSRATA